MDDTSLHLAFTQQSLIGWNHALRGHLSTQWGNTMHLYMRSRYPNSPKDPTIWTRTLIRTLREYSYALWADRNNFLHGASRTETLAHSRHDLILQVTAAYHNRSSVPHDEHGTLFGMPLSLRVTQQSSVLAQWLHQYQAGQARLILLLRNERRSIGTIRRFLIARTTGRRPSIPPG